MSIHVHISFPKAPMMRYGSTKEVPAVVIFSNINTFVYRITAPQRYMCAQSFQL